jgi:hypothetical protein
MDSRPLSRWKKFFSFIPVFGPARHENIVADKEQSTISRIEALKIVNEESNRVTSWSLLIIGGSLLAVLHKDYLKLADYKYLYFIYIIGWLSLCISIYWGQSVTRSYLASMFVKQDLVEASSMEANKLFGRQLTWFMIGVIIFAVWMITFLILWIFNCQIITNE